MMERLIALIRRREFHVFLFVLGLVLFGWPVITFSDIGRLEMMFKYLFLAWMIFIFLLFLVAVSQSVSSGSKESEEGQE